MAAATSFGCSFVVVLGALALAPLGGCSSRVVHTTPDGNAAADAGSGSPSPSPGSNTPRAQSFEGSIAAWPVKVAVDGLVAAKLPIVSVWFSDDGEAWWLMNSNCTSDAGEGRAYSLRDGEIELHETFCTSSATRYQIRVEDGAEHHAGEIIEFPFDVESPLLTPDALPLAQIYTTVDGVTWRADHGPCGTSSTFLVKEPGRLQMRSTYCTSSATAYQVVLAKPADRLEGAAPTSYPHPLASEEVDPSALPSLTAWYFDPSDEGWFSFHGQCNGGHNLHATSEGLLLRDDFCTGQRRYAIAIGVE